MLSKTTFFTVAAMLAGAQAQSGTGVTTRYWDCCKTSCGWSGKASVSHPVSSCDVSNNPLASFDAQSSCNGGGSYACANNSPWAVSDTLAYGYAAVNLSGQTEADWCCSCYELTFTSTAAAGQTMIVQATNTGGDVGGAQFDLMIPGGGVGIFSSGCIAQYGSISGWGATYGGVSSADQCNNLPAALQEGCKFRFGWMKGADNPNVTWKKVTCPSALAGVTGCVRNGEGTVGTSSSSSSSSTSKTSSTSSSTSKTSSTSKESSTSSAPATSSTSSSGPKTSSTSSSSSVSKASSASSSGSKTSSSSSSSSTSSRCVADKHKHHFGHKPHGVSRISSSAVTTSTTGTSTSTGAAAHWGQCGGINWTGPTSCVAPFICTYQNDWYHQCL